MQLKTHTAEWPDHFDFGGDFLTAYVREREADRWQRRESNQAGLGVYLLNIKECIVVDGESHLKKKDEKATAAIRVS